VAACATSVLAAPMRYNPLDVNRDETQILRAMFLTPLQIPAAFGFSYVRSVLRAKLGGDQASRWPKFVVETTLALVFLAILDGAFRALFPLLTDQHNYPNPLAP